jgi:hypothetical protein
MNEAEWLEYWNSLTEEERVEERRMMDAHAAWSDAEALESQRLHREGMDRWRLAQIRNPHLRTLAMAYMDTDDHGDEKRLLIDMLVEFSLAIEELHKATDPRNFGQSGSPMDTFQ